MKPNLTLPSTKTLHWFRRDLRVHDNRALNAAVRHANKCKNSLIALYVIPKSLLPKRCSPIRAQFVLQALLDLQQNLIRNLGIPLHVLRGDETALVPKLVLDWNVSHVFWEDEYSPAAKQRDALVRHKLVKNGCSVFSTYGFMTYDPAVLLAKAPAPKTMKGMFTLVGRVGNPELPEPLPHVKWHIDVDVTPSPIPTLEDLGFEEALDVASQWERFIGGEDTALKRMNDFLSRDHGQAAVQFSKPMTSPAAYSPRDTTILSPYLAHGCISARLFHQQLKKIESNISKSLVLQTTLWGQLMFREHFWLLAHTVDNFGQMKSNAICRQIPWDKDAAAEERLRKWREARTGFPWIDALMTQLKCEGFVHHLGRHSLACFLTRGDLWVSWERGAEVFEHYLIDYDFALNSANWMWLSCSAFFNHYHRIYSPVAFAKKWDPEGDFIKHYLPHLKRVPKEYIHEPWTMSKELQKKVGCVIGKDYPKPMVEHKSMSKINMQRMREAFGTKVGVKRSR